MCFRGGACWSAGTQQVDTPSRMTEGLCLQGASGVSGTLLLEGSAVWDLGRGKALGDYWKLLSLW